MTHMKARAFFMQVSLLARKVRQHHTDIMQVWGNAGDECILVASGYLVSSF